jgi:hypothetical protein
LQNLFVSINIRPDIDNFSSARLPCGDLERQEIGWLNRQGLKTMVAVVTDVSNDQFIKRSASFYNPIMI